MQLLINVAHDEFGKGDCGKDEARILSTSFVSKKSIKVYYLAFNPKKDDQTAKKVG